MSTNAYFIAVTPAEVQAAIASGDLSDALTSYYADRDRVASLEDESFYVQEKLMELVHFRDIGHGWYYAEPKALPAVRAVAAQYYLNQLVDVIDEAIRAQAGLVMQIG